MLYAPQLRTVFKKYIFLWKEVHFMLSYKVSECERGRCKSTGFSWFVHTYKFWLWSWHQDKYDPNTSKSTQRKIPRCASAQPSAIFMCLVLPFLNATTNTGTIAYTPYIHQNLKHRTRIQFLHNSYFSHFIFVQLIFLVCVFFQVFFFDSAFGLSSNSICV